ncbi:MAG: H-NS histone family protein [Hyphomicrobiales bacterium]|nr:MAG: H-NS histone family protein [Hyphomicrobiales bacterium]
MATYAQLKKQIEQLSKKAEAALRAEKDEVLAKVREAVGSFSLTVEEVFGLPSKKQTRNAKPATAKRVPKGAGQAKYADPKTGATWSGFGRAPAWIASAKDRTKFLVDQQPAATGQAKPKAVKSVAKRVAASKPTKAHATKKAAAAAVPAAPAKRSAKAVASAPAKKVVKTSSKAKAPTPAKKAVSKAAAPAKEMASPKPNTKVPEPQAAAPVAATVVSSQV